MIVADLSGDALAHELGGSGLRLRTGPFVTAVRSRLASVRDGIRLHYADHPLEPLDCFADFEVAIGPPANVRRWIRPQCLFYFEGVSPFRPLPAEQAFPMLEWGLNWCVSAHAHQYLAIHAAVVAHGERALLVPAPPGTGKSTLCAALVSSGWRLLSDELALIDTATGMLAPLVRPISLKNQSIDVIRAFDSRAMLGPIVHDTSKGDVAHMKPPAASVRASRSPAVPTWILLLRYERGASAALLPVSRARGFMQLADNAFNYSIHGASGFDAIGAIVDRCTCYEFTYGDLEAAIAQLDRLASE